MCTGNPWVSSHLPRVDVKTLVRQRVDYPLTHQVIINLRHPSLFVRVPLSSLFVCTPSVVVCPWIIVVIVRVCVFIVHVCVVIIVRRLLFAMPLTATWPLLLVLKKERGRGVALLTWIMWTVTMTWVSPFIWAWMEGWAGGDRNAGWFCHIPCGSPSARVSPRGHSSMVGVVPCGRSCVLVNRGGGSLWPVGHHRCSLVVVLGTRGCSWAVVAIPRSWWWILVANRRGSWWALVAFRGGCEKRVW